ncbi:MAG: GTPase HflX, partial [Porticoccaceae bacterium]
VWVSAASGAGLDLLEQAIRERLGGEMVSGRYYLAPGLARLRARLYALGAIVDDESVDDGGTIVRLSIPAADFNRLLKGESLGRSDLPSVADTPVVTENA